MDIYWLRQSESDTPVANDWLHASELARLVTLRIPKRRTDWRLGRWAAKCAVSAFLDMPRDYGSLAEIEIRAADSGMPEAFLSGHMAPLTVSLSHRGGVAMCAVCGMGAAIGCDLELIEARSDEFIADYFTTAEQELLAHSFPEDRWRLAAVLWSGKESVLKALKQGLRVDPRSIEVLPEATGSASRGWLGLAVNYVGPKVLRGCWKQDNGLVMTLVSDLPAPTVLTELSMIT